MSADERAEQPEQGEQPEQAPPVRGIRGRGAQLRQMQLRQPQFQQPIQQQPIRQRRIQLQIQQQREQQQQQQETSLYRTRHEELVRGWTADTVSPRRLRQELVKYYLTVGYKQLDERFFANPSIAP